MSVGAIFILIIVLVVLAVLGSIFFFFSRRQAVREQDPRGDRLHPGSDEDPDRPEHVRASDEDEAARTFRG